MIQKTSDATSKKERMGMSPDEPPVMCRNMEIHFLSYGASDHIPWPASKTDAKNKLHFMCRNIVTDFSWYGSPWQLSCKLSVKDIRPQCASGFSTRKRMY